MGWHLRYVYKWDIFAVVYEISLGFKHQTEVSRGNFLMGRMCICEHDNGNQARFMLPFGAQFSKHPRRRSKAVGLGT